MPRLFTWFLTTITRWWFKELYTEGLDSAQDGSSKDSMRAIKEKWVTLILNIYLQALTGSWNRHWAKNFRHSKDDIRLWSWRQAFTDFWSGFRQRVKERRTSSLLKLICLIGTVAVTTAFTARDNRQIQPFNQVNLVRWMGIMRGLAWIFLVIERIF